MVHGWPFPSCGVDRGVLLWGSICHHVKREASRFIPSILQLLVDAVTPMALEMALAVQHEIQARLDEADRVRHRQVERAQYDADRARHRFMKVDPA